MTRDAKLFFLNGIDYTPIKTKIESEKDARRLSNEIAIFFTSEEYNNYIVLSVSERIDKIALENGGILCGLDDLYMFGLKNKMIPPGNLVFGEEILLEFLPAEPAAG